MDGRKLQDRLYLGLGRSARFVGETADAFRPRGPIRPLEKENRFLRLPAAFVSTKGSEARTNGYGEPLWHGIFDASYTQAGDYLTLGSRCFFIASQAALLPVLCVLTNRTISIARPSMQTATAINSYGGYTVAGSVMLMENWPASVLGENKSSPSEAKLPTDQTTPYWIVLMPSSSDVSLSPGDVVTDELGRTAVVAGSELTDLGWRISAKMATT